MRRRLLERFQQRVERVIREHVHLVDEVHLEPAARRRVLNVVEQLAGVVDLGARRRVDFDEIDEPPLVDGRARRAHAARLGHDARLAVQRFREQARDRRLADAARAGEQIRVVQAIVGERVRQRLDDVRLPDEFLEPPRPPLARQNRVTHALSRLLENERSAPARPRHPTGLLPLLPSGPDGVYSWLSRGNRRGPSLLYQLVSGGAIQRARAGLKRRRVLGYAARPGCAQRRQVRNSGEVAEWLKAHAWKVCIRPKSVSRVRIPPSPPRST